MSMLVHTLPMRMSLAYLIEGEQGLVLVDAGLRGDEGRVISKLQSLGRYDLRLIFVTHAHLDHYGSAASLRRLTGAPIAIHPADEEAMTNGQTLIGSARNLGRAMAALFPLVHPLLRPEPAKPDLLLKNGADLKEFGLDATVLHTPGHTVGSSCLIVDERIAFAGDLVTNTRGPRLQRYFAQNWNLLSQSLERLRAIKPKWVFAGHGRQPLSGSDLQKLELA